MAIEIYDVNDLQAMNTLLTADYILMNDIDASDTEFWNGGAGFVPIGGATWATQFRGTLEGNGFIISNLFINRVGTDHIGLFGHTRNGSGFLVKNLGLADCVISGSDRVGGIVGNQVDVGGIIENCFVTGTLNSSTWAAPGGICGLNSGTIRNCYSRATLNCGGNASNGGICAVNNGTIQKCYYAGVMNGTTTRHGIAATGSSSDCFWDTTVSTTSVSSGGGTGKTTAEMKNVATFTELATVGLNDPWDFRNDPFDDTGTEDIWDIISSYNDGYPFLSFEFSPPVFQTLDATDITDVGARLNGELVDPAGQTFDLSFRYRLVSSPFWKPEILVNSNVTTPQTFFHILSGLDPSSNYEFQAIFRFDVFEEFGGTKTFTTLAVPVNPVVTTLTPTNNTGTSIDLQGELVGLGDESIVNLFFEYKKVDAPSWIEVLSVSGVSAPQVYSTEVSGLDEGELYEYRAVVKWDSDSQVYIGNVITFFTAEGIDDAPSLYYIKEGIEIPDGKSVYFGDSNIDTSWRLKKANGSLIFQRREMGDWIIKEIIN